MAPNTLASTHAIRFAAMAALLGLSGYFFCSFLATDPRTIKYSNGPKRKVQTIPGNTNGTNGRTVKIFPPFKEC